MNAKALALHHQNETPESLDRLRWLVTGLWIFKIVTEPVSVWKHLPMSLFDPVGFMKVLPEFVYPWLVQPAFLWGLKGVTILLLLCAASNIMRNIAAVGACLLLTFYQGIFRGFAGHIPHVDAVALYALYFLAVFPLADQWVRKHDSRSHPSWNPSEVSFVAILFVLCLSYTLVGVYRIVHAGPEVFTGGSIHFWMMRNSYQHSEGYRQIVNFVFDTPFLRWMLQVGFPVVTAFEVLAPCCLFSRRFRLAFLAVMIPFHFLSQILLRVFFWENLVLYVLLLDEKLWRRINGLDGAPGRRSAA